MHKFKLTAILLTIIASITFASGAFADDNQMRDGQKQTSHHRGEHERATKAADPQGKIDLNSADAKSLTLLKGIGEKRAEAIIKYREANGPFKSIDELSKVKGISKSIIDKNRDHLTI
jgi:competence protein ComEA